MMRFIDDHIVPSIDTVNFMKLLCREGLDRTKHMMHRMRSQTIHEQATEITIFEDLAKASQCLLKNLLAMRDKKQLRVTS